MFYIFIYGLYLPVFWSNVSPKNKKRKKKKNTFTIVVVLMYIHSITTNYKFEFEEFEKFFFWSVFLDLLYIARLHCHLYKFFLSRHIRNIPTISNMSDEPYASFLILHSSLFYFIHIHPLWYSIGFCACLILIFCHYSYNILLTKLMSFMSNSSIMDE